MRRSTSGWVVSTALALSGCQLVTGLGSLETEQPGTGGTASSAGGAAIASTSVSGSSTSAVTSGMGGATSTSTSTSASTASASSTDASVASSSSATSSSVASSSSSSMQTELTPCGGVVDTFTTLDGNVWNTQGAQDQNQSMVVSGGNQPGYVELATPAQFDECYVSVRLKSTQNQTHAVLAFFDSTNEATQNLGIEYNSGTATLSVFNGTGSSQFGAPPAYVGIALHAGQMYLLKNANGSTWSLFATLPRPTWMNDGADDLVRFGNYGPDSGKQVTFDDFNVNAITLADLN